MIFADVVTSDVTVFTRLTNCSRSRIVTRRFPIAVEILPPVVVCMLITVAKNDASLVGTRVANL